MEDIKHEFDTYSYSYSFQTENNPNLISILSWNILLEEHEAANVWKHRLKQIKSTLYSSNSDIICLQEVDKRSFVNDFDEFHQKYNYSFSLNTKRKKNFSQVIMYKNTKFECKYEDYRDRVTIILLSNKLEQQNCTKCIHSRNLCIYHSFFVATVHLNGWTNGRNDESTRLNQAKSLLKRINYCITQKWKLDLKKDTDCNNIRIILIGDFNTCYHSVTAQMLTQNNCPHFQHTYKFEEAYNQELIYGNYEHHALFSNHAHIRLKYFPTYCDEEGIQSLDMLFYTNANMKLQGVKETLPDILRKEIKWNKSFEQRINEDNIDFSAILNLPNNEIPSDHLPIGGILQMDSLCDANNNKEVCQCSVKKKEKHKIKRREYGNAYETRWRFHKINSF